jgi:Lrp/AsnC family leucine-responsive transcriptional regulator
MELDRYERAIVRLLQQDARITNTLLAAKVNLSESACLRRVRALEECGLRRALRRLRARCARCPR